MKYPKHVRHEASSILQYIFHHGQFKIHDPKGIVVKHYELMSLSWPYTHEQWSVELPQVNAKDWDDVLEKIRTLGLVTFNAISPGEQLNELNRRLVVMERTKKRGIC